MPPSYVALRKCLPVICTRASLDTDPVERRAASPSTLPPQPVLRDQAQIYIQSRVRSFREGQRHTLREFVTVLIQRAGTSIPFNIQGLHVIEYDETSPRSVEKAKNEITRVIRNGLNNCQKDSLVHEMIDTRSPIRTLFEHADAAKAPYMLARASVL